MRTVGRQVEGRCNMLPPRRRGRGLLGGRPLLQMRPRRRWWRLGGRLMHSRRRRGLKGRVQLLLLRLWRRRGGLLEERGLLELLPRGRWWRLQQQWPGLLLVL